MLKYSKMKDEKFMTDEEKSNKKINHLLDNLVKTSLHLFIIINFTPIFF